MTARFTQEAYCWDMYGHEGATSDDSQPRDDRYDLERFVTAQATTYTQALQELRRGAKQTHWMWFVFPQLAGLGSSAMAQQYAIRSLDEARAYLAHPVLGARLHECAEALLQLDGRTAREVFGSPDDLKLRSSLTLFREVAEDLVFSRVLEHYFDGVGDDRTMRLLADVPG